MLPCTIDSAGGRTLTSTDQISGTSQNSANPVNAIRLSQFSQRLVFIIGAALQNQEIDRCEDQQQDEENHRHGIHIATIGGFVVLLEDVIQQEIASLIWLPFAE